MLIFCLFAGHIYLITGNNNIIIFSNFSYIYLKVDHIVKNFFDHSLVKSNDKLLVWGNMTYGIILLVLMWRSDRIIFINMTSVKSTVDQ